MKPGIIAGNPEKEREIFKDSSSYFSWTLYFRLNIITVLSFMDMLKYK